VPRIPFSRLFDAPDREEKPITRTRVRLIPQRNSLALNRAFLLRNPDSIFLSFFPFTLLPAFFHTHTGERFRFIVHVVPLASFFTRSHFNPRVQRQTGRRNTCRYLSAESESTERESFNGPTAMI
jgi:hypothetical protein